MPHPSSRRQKKKAYSNSKRIEITDEDGWVHVVNAHTPSLSRLSTAKKTGDKSADGISDGPNNSPPSLHSSHEQEDNLVILPAEAPPRLTLSALRQKFDADLATFQSSSTWQRLEESLPLIIEDGLGKQGSIDKVVCIGLGSPSGLRNGWVDRRDVASYQLAALVSLIDYINHQHSQGLKVKEEMKILAQDPVFNTLDKQLLCSLGVTVVDSPEGFSSVTPNTFLFAPGAERRHLEIMLPYNPMLVFGGPLEEAIMSSTSGVREVETFLETRESLKVAEFAPRPEAFWRMRVYWRRSSWYESQEGLEKSEVEEG